jgi:outer membrane protein TolC
MSLIRLLLGIVGVWFSFGGYAQSAVIARYTEEAITNSDALKQLQFQLQRNLYALEEAKGLFLPAVNLTGTYTLAAGGRSIAIPIGDLLNPVYSTLNQLTNTNQFRQLENVSENFNPNNFYDIKVRTTYPVLNPSIRYNQDIKGLETELQSSNIAIYKQELTRQVRLAYFQHLQSLQAVTIYQNAIVLLQENLRVNQKLYENGMANPTVLTRATNEIIKVEAQQIEAQNQSKNAAAYLNFLLNKPFETPVTIDSTLFDITYNFPQLLEGSIQNREELRQLLTAESLQNTVLKINQSYKVPRINAFLDVGSQGFNFDVGGDSFYLLGGVTIDLPIYNGNRNEQKINIAAMELAATTSQRNAVEDQLALQLQTSKTNYLSALRLFQSSKAQVETAQRYFNDTVKRFREGAAIYVEYLDARNELTNAQLQQSIQLFQVWNTWVEVQRAIGD